MATTPARTESARPGAPVPVPAVHVPASSLRGDLRAIKIVWKRELIRFSKDKLRMVTSLVQPFLFLFVLGTGLSRLASAGTHGVDLRTFVYPGVLCMAVLFTAMFSAASLVWDREFGFLREMLVAPVSRAAIVVGKCLGGATIASESQMGTTQPAQVIPGDRCAKYSGLMLRCENTACRIGPTT